MSITMKNQEITVTLHSPEDETFSARFDQIFAAKQVVLHGKYEFCEPEQRSPERRSGGGIGLSGEFVWDELGAEAKKGQQFIKPGVGLLTQVEDDKPYDMWAPYQVERFVTTVAVQEPERVVLAQDIPTTNGIGMKIIREAVLWQNTLTLHTHIENTGTRPISMAEYQHNFVSINHAPIDKGYCLQLPCNLTLNDMPNRCFVQGAEGPAPGVLRTEGDRLYWDDSMERKVLFQAVDDEKNVADMARYSWTLSHANSPAQVQEIAYFRPSMLRLWGIDHCVSTEFFCPIKLEAGGKMAFARTWVFAEKA